MSARGRDVPAAYVALADELRSAIRRRTYASDGRLPTEKSLAESHRLSRQTVRRAYLDLVAEGLVKRVPGRGTFVVTDPPKYMRQFGSIEDLLALATDTTMQIVQPLEQRVDIEAAARLGLTSDLVHRLTYVRRHREAVLGFTTVSVSTWVAAHLQDSPDVTRAGATSSLTVIGLLEERLHTRITHAEQSITAVTADQALSGRLGCAVGDPLLRIDRLFLDADDVAVELSLGHYLPEQYSYRIQLRR